MFGVILFTIILLFYGFLLSTELLSRAFPAAKEFFNSVEQFTEKGAVRVILAIIGIITGVWNFFAPDFTAAFSAPIVGALIPSLLIIFDSTVLYPNIVEILNIPQDSKNKYYSFIEKFRGYAGIVTLVAGILHIILFRQILF